RHDIDALVERVRAVAMAENRPSTPGSHIDWAGEEDDSLPDLDDWGVTTIRTSAGDRGDEISPILADALKPLPEPQTEEDAEDEEEHHVEPLDNDGDGEITKDLSDSSPLSNAPTVQDTIVATTTDAHDTPAVIVAPETVAHVDKLSLNPSLHPKPIAATEGPRASSTRSKVPSKPAPIAGGEEPIAAKKGEDLSQSIHAPSLTEVAERTLSSSSSDYSLATSIHAPKGLPESRSAPSLMSPTAPTPARGFSPSHGRSKTEGRPPFPHPRAAPATAASQRAARSGTTSPLGPGNTHARNHSTPPGGAGQRVPHARPVITGDALSRLARTIGGVPAMPRAQGVAVAKD
ncbi:uncharacterized protein EDB91DRAFT_1043734, partial [Suillus paluster]|uniref:uncharacterized protein n=1 Tax=Suillus paluster TaxID=48578 RepID=UPI001B871531